MPRIADARPKGLGLAAAVALVAGHTIGIGIFLTPAELIGGIASPALTLGLWVGCGALVLAGALTFGELASRYPQAGGIYIYLRHGWGARIAFLYGWQSLLIMDPGVTAALATGLSEYMVVLWPGARGAERSIAITGIWILAILSAMGLTLGTRVLAVMTGVKFLAFAGIVVAAFAAGAGSWSHFDPFFERHLSTVRLPDALAIGLVSVFFSFGGFWEARRVAAEVHDSRRTMPLALAIGVAGVSAVYVATTAALIFVVPVQEVTSASELARRAGEAMLGDAGPSLLAAIVVLSVMTSLLALLIMAPRLYVAMSRDGLFPPSLASVNATTQSPVRSTMVLAILASGFVLVGTFHQILAFFMCTTLAFVALAAASLIVVRRRGVAGAEAPALQSPFQTPGYPVTPVLFILLILSVVALVAISRPAQALAGLGLVLLGVPVYSVFGRRQPGP